MKRCPWFFCYAINSKIDFPFDQLVFLLFSSGNRNGICNIFTATKKNNTYGKDLAEQDSVHTELKWKKNITKIKINEKKTKTIADCVPVQYSDQKQWFLQRLFHNWNTIPFQLKAFFSARHQSEQSTVTNSWTIFKCELNVGRISLK